MFSFEQDVNNCTSKIVLDIHVFVSGLIFVDYKSFVSEINYIE